MTPDFLNTTETIYPTQMRHFNDLIEKDQLSHLYLFVGPSQLNKLAFSRYIAWQVVGANKWNVQRIIDDTHPDVKITQPSLPKSGSGTKRTWKVEQIRALKPEFVTMARESSRKVFIFDSVETLRAESGNALLKFIEEPAGPQIMMMLAENVNDVLPTIRSRAQIIHLRPEVVVEADYHETDEWQQATQQLLFKWFELMMQRKIEAFAFVQQYLLVTLKDDQQQQLFLSWLHKLIRDTVVYGQVPDTNLCFPKLVGLYKTLDKQYTKLQLVHASDAVLLDDELRQKNMTLQTRLEKIVLDVAIALGD